MIERVYEQDKLVKDLKNIHSRLAEKLKQYDDKELEEIHSDLGTIKRGVQHEPDRDEILDRLLEAHAHLEAVDYRLQATYEIGSAYSIIADLIHDLGGFDSDD